MANLGIPYQIKPGDTLWDLAATHLGAATEWPRLYEFNNRSEVVQAGVRRIVDPDLIYAGSTLRLPIVQSAAAPVAPVPSLPSANAPRSGRLRDEIPRIFMPFTSAYELKGKPIVLDYVAYIARVSIVGRVDVTLGNALPLTLVAGGSFETTAKTRCDNAFTSLMSETSVGYDFNTGQIKFSNKMINSANNIPGPSYGVGIEGSSTSGMPVLKAEIQYPELKGKVGNDSFVAANLTIVIEIEPRRPVPPQPIPVPVHRPVPSARQTPESGIDWRAVFKDAAVGTLVVATVVTVAYGASVFFTAGASSAAAPAYASAMGVLLIGGTAATINVSTGKDQTVY